MTCFYWHTYKNCKYPEPLCLYSHSYDGKVGIAGAPIHKEPGSKSLPVFAPSAAYADTRVTEPAVAGNNAKQENPVYHDWTPNRGVITLRSGRSNTMGPPEVNHDIKNPTVEHGSHGMDVDRPTTLYAELQGGQEVGYDEKLVKEEGEQYNWSPRRSNAHFCRG